VVQIIQKLSEYFKVESKNRITIYWIEKRMDQLTEKDAVPKMGDLVEFK
jgi:hypothetical protein